jgi:hypothetical protein
MALHVTLALLMDPTAGRHRLASAGGCMAVPPRPAGYQCHVDGQYVLALRVQRGRDARAPVSS